MSKYSPLLNRALVKLEDLLKEAAMLADEISCEPNLTDLEGLAIEQKAGDLRQTAKEIEKLAEKLRNS